MWLAFTGFARILDDIPKLAISDDKVSRIREEDTSVVDPEVSKTARA